MYKTNMELTKNSREVETECLKIHGNCLEFNDTVVQLSNISLLSTENIALEAFPKWTLVLILIGIVLFAIKKAVFVLLGIALIAFGIYAIYQWNAGVQKAKEMKKLLLITNSGNLFTIVFQDQKFLAKVIQVLTEIIANPNRVGDVIINVKDSTFSGQSSVVRELTNSKS